MGYGSVSGATSTSMPCGVPATSLCSAPYGVNGGAVPCGRAPSSPLPTPAPVASPVPSKPVFTGFAGAAMLLVGAGLLGLGAVMLTGSRRRRESHVIR